jgi:hypothetical protein
LQQNPEHPRLFFGANHIETLREQAENSHQHIWAPIITYAETEVGSSPPESSPDASQNDYREFGNQLIPFAFACIITDSEDYCNLARRYLLTYASWERWSSGEEIDLGLSHMVLGNAIAYDWMHPYLTSDERAWVRESLAQWAEKLYQGSVQPYDRDGLNNWWRSTYIQNHYLINHSALGVAALALSGEHERAPIWLEQAYQKMARVKDLLEGIEDGTWHESISYQSYKLTMSLPFMINLRRYDGRDIIPHTYMENYTYWRLYNYLSNSQFILPFGDVNWSAETIRFLNILRFNANEYNDGHAQWLANESAAVQGRYGNVWGAPWFVFEFLSYNPDIEPEGPGDLDTSRVFPDLEGVIWRTGWGENEMVFALKTGPFGGRFAFDTFIQETYPWDPPCDRTGCSFNADHDHADANGFYLYRAGEWLAPEHLGYELYDTSYHNTLLIDGEGQTRVTNPRMWNDVEAFIGTDGFLETTASVPDFDYVAADATRRYGTITDLQDFTRHVVFVRPRYFVMVDHIAAQEQHTYEWVSHFEDEVSLDRNWVLGRAEDDQILGVAVAAPKSVSTKQGNDGKPYIRIRPSSPVANTRFINVLYPTSEENWDNRPDVSILDDTSTGSALRVERNDGSGRTDDIVINHTMMITSSSTLGPYKYNGKVAVVSRGATGNIEKLFVQDGTFLTDTTSDRELVSNLAANSTFEAVFTRTTRPPLYMPLLVQRSKHALTLFQHGMHATRIDNPVRTVKIYGDIHTSVTLYAPDANRLLINGKEAPFTRSGNYITFKNGDIGRSSERSRLHLPG